MDVLVPAAPISPLRQRLIDHTTMRELSRETRRNDIHDVGRFAISWGVGPIRPHPGMCAVSRANRGTPTRPASHQATRSVAYGAGLRVADVASLKGHDIDRRMLTRVEWRQRRPAAIT